MNPWRLFHLLSPAMKLTAKLTFFVSMGDVLWEKTVPVFLRNGGKTFSPARFRENAASGNNFFLLQFYWSGYLCAVKMTGVQKSYRSRLKVIPCPSRSAFTLPNVGSWIHGLFLIWVQGAHGVQSLRHFFRLKSPRLSALKKIWLISRINVEIRFLCRQIWLRPA